MSGHFGPTRLQRIKQSVRMLETEVDGELVALSVESGKCYGFNKVASRIWQLIAEPKSVAEICAAMEAEFKIDPATCEAQVAELLEQLHREGLIEPVC
jgi:uncharacterized membrane protein